MKTSRPYTAFLLACAAMLTAAAFIGSSAKAAPSDKVNRGSLGDLSATWLQWVTSIPGAASPLFDATGQFADQNQSGPVFFLAGENSGDAVTRHVTIPAGSQILLPALNYFWVNTPELGDPQWTAKQQAQVRALLDSVINAFVKDGTMTVTVDGQALDLRNGRAQNSKAFQVNLPDDNVMSEIFGAQVLPGPHDCMIDGYYALIPALTSGTHAIHLTESFPDFGFDQDVTFIVTVP